MPRSYEELVKDLESGRVGCCAAAAGELERLGDYRALEPLARVAAEPPWGSYRCRDAAGRAMLQIVDDQNLHFLVWGLRLGFLYGREFEERTLDLLERVRHTGPAIHTIAELSHEPDVTLGKALTAVKVRATDALIRLGCPLTPCLVRELCRRHLAPSIGDLARQALLDAGVPESRYPDPAAFLGDNRAIPTMVRALQGETVEARRRSRGVRRDVVRGWAEAAPDSAPPLLRLLWQPHRTTALWAAEALGWIADDGSAEQLRPLLAHADAGLRLCAAVGLGHTGEPAVVEALAAALESPDMAVRLASAGALCAAGAAGSRALPALHARLARESNAEARSLFREAIGSITGALRRGPAELVASLAPAGRGTELEAPAGEP